MLTARIDLLGKETKLFLWSLLKIKDFSGVG